MDAISQAVWNAIVSHRASEWKVVTDAPSALGLCILAAGIPMFFGFRWYYREQLAGKDRLLEISNERHKQKDEFIEQLKNAPPTSSDELKARLDALEKGQQQRWPRLHPDQAQKIGQELVRLGVRQCNVACVFSSDARDLAQDFGLAFRNSQLRGSGGYMVQSFGMFPLNQGEGLWVSYDKDGAAIAQQMKTAIEQEFGFPVATVCTGMSGTELMLNIGQRPLKGVSK